MNNTPPTPPGPPPQPDDEKQTSFIARFGAATVGPYPSIYALHRSYLEDYRQTYDPGATFEDVPAESTLRNAISKSSGGFWSTVLQQNKGGKRTLPLPLIIQKLN